MTGRRCHVRPSERPALVGPRLRPRHGACGALARRCGALRGSGSIARRRSCGTAVEPPLGCPDAVRRALRATGLQCRVRPAVRRSRSRRSGPVLRRGAGRCSVIQQVAASTASPCSGCKASTVRRARYSFCRAGAASTAGISGTAQRGNGMTASRTSLPTVEGTRTAACEGISPTRLPPRPAAPPDRCGARPRHSPGDGTTPRRTPVVRGEYDQISAERLGGIGDRLGRLSGQTSGEAGGRPDAFSPAPDAEV